jgi:hypothetical protein
MEYHLSLCKIEFTFNQPPLHVMQAWLFSVLDYQIVRKPIGKYNFSNDWSLMQKRATDQVFLSNLQVEICYYFIIQETK